MFLRLQFLNNYKSELSVSRTLRNSGKADRTRNIASTTLCPEKSPLEFTIYLECLLFCSMHPSYTENSSTDTENVMNSVRKPLFSSLNIINKIIFV